MVLIVTVTVTVSVIEEWHGHNIKAVRNHLYKFSDPQHVFSSLVIFIFSTMEAKALKENSEKAATQAYSA